MLTVGAKVRLKRTHYITHAVRHKTHRSESETNLHHDTYPQEW